MIKIMLFQNDQTPFGADFPLELLGDGKVLSKGTTDAKGVVSFDVDVLSIKSLAVRIDKEALQMLEQKAEI
jgi:hypothetical protein